jgi:hypothetical protein
MNISLTPEQYKTLLLITYLGNWLVNAHKIEPDKTFDDLAKYIYSFATSFGITGLVESSPDDGVSYPTRQFEDLAEEYLSDYDNHTFWDELIDRLVERDFVAKYGEEAIEKMTLEEQFSNRDEFEERYAEEFEEYGLDRVTIKKDEGS